MECKCGGMNGSSEGGIEYRAVVDDSRGIRLGADCEWCKGVNDTYLSIVGRTL